MVSRNFYLSFICIVLVSFKIFFDSPTIGGGIWQPETVAALGEIAKDYMKKKRTIVLSNATQGIKNDLIDMLCLVEKGVSWSNKPSLQQCSQFAWLDSQEDSEENREQESLQ